MINETGPKKTPWNLTMRQSAIVLVGVGVLIVVGAYVIGRTASDGLVNAPVAAPIVQTGTNVTRQPFGNWSLDCGDLADRARQCTLNMQVVNQTREGSVLILVVNRDQGGTPVLMIHTPPGVTVSRGVTLTPGDTASVRGEFETCGPQRCRARIPLDEAMRTALATAQITSVTFHSLTGQPVNYNLPTEGFGPGFAAWEMEGSAPQRGSELAPDSMPVSTNVN